MTCKNKYLFYELDKNWETNWYQIWIKLKLVIYFSENLITQNCKKKVNIFML